jgi:hypothetical protein
MYMDSIKYNEITQVNRASRKAYEQIQSEGIKDVYYLSREDLNIPSGGWVDYVHPSDFGMQQQAAAVERKVREILHIPLGSLTTTIPVTQRREPNMYEWQIRHRTFLEQVRNHPQPRFWKPAGRMSFSQASRPFLLRCSNSPPQ